MKFPKAPKDMTAPELVAEIRKRFGDVPYINQCAFSMEQFDDIMEEPTPEPFTSDQLGWMRIERDSKGIHYAALQQTHFIGFFAEKPRRSEKTNSWVTNAGYIDVINADKIFLGEILEVDDQEPFCFDDYLD